MMMLQGGCIIFGKFQIYHRFLQENLSENLNCFYMCFHEIFVHLGCNYRKELDF